MKKQKSSLEMREVVLSETIPITLIIALEKLGVWKRQEKIVSKFFNEVDKRIRERVNDEFLKNCHHDKMPRA